MIAPAPRKPIPVTICAAIRGGSTRTPQSVNPYAETRVNSADPTHTRRWVRSPAWRSRHSRSSPIAPPSTAARKSRSSTSAQPIVGVVTRLWELTCDRFGLKRPDLGDAPCGQLEQLVERLARERVAFGGRLHLDEAAVAGHDDVHVGVGARVLGVVEVEQRDTVDDPDGHGRDRVPEGAGETETLERAHPGDVGATDRGAARAAVGLEDVAVEPERPF